MAGAPAEAPVDVVLGAPDPTRVPLVVIDGVEGAPPRSFPDAPVFEGVVKTDFEVRNGVIALPTERLKGATLFIRSANDEWGFPENIVPMRVPIDVSKGTTRVRLLAGLSIVGTVVRRDGTVVTHAVVKGVSRVDPFFSPTDAKAGIDGRFRLEGLAPGDYDVSSGDGARHSTPVVVTAGTKGVRLVVD